MGLFRNARKKERLEMVVDRGEGFYSFDGKLYHSDIVRSCIKAKTKAIGKTVAKHVRETIKDDGTKEIEVNPLIYMRFLLEEPNPLMSWQVMEEKLANQLWLNNNSFALIVRDDNGLPVEIYPIPCVSVYKEYQNEELHLRFIYKNGKSNVFPYTEIIHIRDDFITDDVFGDAPGKALEELMECVTTIDQGIIKAVKNSSFIMWLLKYKSSLRADDLKKNVKEFVDNYLKIESDTFGAAGVDSKVDAERIEPKDYVPNALVTDRIITRIHNFFGTNEKIVSNEYNEDEWAAFYDGCISPILSQMSTEYTRKLFTRAERLNGNKIVFEASNLMFASVKTKLDLVQFVDRGIMTPNEVRGLLNMAPIQGGDKALLRKDTGRLEEGEEGNETGQD
ncbi:MAG: phage portal protein [Clostridiales bacterium]|nr:phage portal protein [Roseburia sp.]MDD7635309.1 phage portal protein [Clostridiales bacterium]MDY4113977.1 phage portal protein [Roseburia sp.]